MSEKNSSEGVSGGLDPKLVMEALTSEMRRLMREGLDEMHDTVERKLEMALGSSQGQKKENPPRRKERYEDEISEGEESVDDYRRKSRGNRNWNDRGARTWRDRGDRNWEDNNLGNIKMKIPPFQGKNDPEAYLEWEKKVELVFDCHEYSERKKVKLAAIEFSDYAIVWWDQLMLSRRRNGEPPVETWEEMKRIMKKRFVPAYFQRELHNKLQNLKQGSRSVDDYFKEMEITMIRANVVEDREATMARFLAGLNRDIQNIVELQHYVELEEMVHMAIKVENQFKKKGSSHNRFSQGSSSSNWKTSTWKKEEKSFSTKPKSEQKQETSTPGDQGKSNSTHRNRDITCFKCQGKGHIASQCPNKRAMVMKNGEIVTDSESDHDSMPSLEDASDEEIEEEAEEGRLIAVVKRVLNVQVKEEVDVQRENIFHTRCHINNQLCSMIIDGGSCTNVVSTFVVEKLGLKTTKHPTPYKLQWLNDSGETKVTKQSMVVFRIGRYEDEVLCDVVPMQACHILLGRPWQFDRKAIHDGFLNKYSLVHQGKSFTLRPLTPKQVYDDQLQLQQAMGKHKESDKNKESEGSKEKNKKIENPKEWKAGKSERSQAERGPALVVREKESAALQKESCVARVSSVRKALVMK